MPRDDYHIEALERGLRVLEAFSPDSPSLTMTEIAQQTGLNKSTAFRVTHTLDRLGYLKRNPDTKRYRPGLKVLRLGFSALSSLEMGQVAQPFLKALSSQCGWTSNMTVRDEADIVYVARNKTQQILSVDLHLGSRLPAYCTSMGKALLSDLARQELQDLMGAGPYERRGPNTITSLKELEAALAQVRAQGYAVNDEELVAGLRAVAAPVRGHTNDVTAAINVSVPSVRVSLHQLEHELAALVVETARQISLTLGARYGPRRALTAERQADQQDPFGHREAKGGGMER